MEEMRERMLLLDKEIQGQLEVLDYLRHVDVTDSSDDAAQEYVQSKLKQIERGLSTARGEIAALTKYMETYWLGKKA